MKFITATDRYIARLVIVPMLGTLVIAAMLLVLDKMLRLFDFVAAEGGPVSIVWKMLANLIPEYLSLAIPIGLMLGILLGFRKLAMSSELDIFRAIGQDYLRLLRVPYLIAILFAFVNLALVGYIQPLSRYQYEQLGFELRSGALGASIKVGEFTNFGKNMTIRIEASEDEGRKLSGLFVRVATARGAELTATATSGTFMATADDPDVIILRLTDGSLIHDDPAYATPRVLSFSSHDLPIDLPKIEAFRSRGGKDREYLLPELVRIGGNAALPEDLRIKAQSNFHFRMVEVAMMLLLPLLALALAVPPKRSSSSLGIFISIIMIVTYHKINEYGEDAGALGIVDPVLALWGPFVLFAALILWMFWRIAYVPGGQPIGALESAFAKIGKGVRSLFRFGRKQMNGPGDTADGGETA